MSAGERTSETLSPAPLIPNGNRAPKIYLAPKRYWGARDNFLHSVLRYWLRLLRRWNTSGNGAYNVVFVVRCYSVAQQGLWRDLRDRRRQDVGVEPPWTDLRRVSRVSPESLPSIQAIFY